MSDVSLQSAETIRNLALFPEENPFPVLRIDESGVLRYANRASTELLTSWQCVVGEAVPDYIFQEVSTTLLVGLNRELETRCGERDFSFAMVPIVERGYVNFYGRDVTGHKRIQAALVRSEERLKRAQEIARLGSWELDLLDNRLIWSDEVYRIFGIQSTDFEASYEAFLEAIHPDDRAAVDRAYADSIREGRDSYEIEHRIVQKNTGEVRYVHEKCVHNRDKNGKIISSVGMVHDVTERLLRKREIERLNADLTARAAELETVNRELETFNYTVAHDLRKPLTVISGYIQFLLEQYAGKLDPHATDYLGRIHDSTHNMSRLIDALLDFSSLAHVELHLEPVDVSALAKEVVAELTLAEPERRIRVRIAEELTVEGDVDLLRVALANLLGNAWKYTLNKAEAFIEVGKCDIAGQAVLFIRDNGIGFVKEDSEKLFLPFQRLSGVGNIAGLGIGLATVERIIQRHRGKIWAEGSPDQGATFYLALGMSETENSEVTGDA
jgi:PAS domain S-box-containing protein